MSTNTNEKGLFELREPQDLFKKLEWEFKQFKNSPDDQYLAFNFFGKDSITAIKLSQKVYDFWEKYF